MTPPTPAGPDDRFAPAQDVHARAFDGETVIVDLRGGDYFGLNEIGAALWQGLVDGRSAREVARDLEPRFSVEPERLLADLVALVQEMVERRLLQPRP